MARCMKKVVVTKIRKVMRAQKRITKWISIEGRRRALKKMYKMKTKIVFDEMMKENKSEVCDNYENDCETSYLKSLYSSEDEDENNNEFYDDGAAELANVIEFHDSDEYDDDEPQYYYPQ